MPSDWLQERGLVDGLIEAQEAVNAQPLEERRKDAVRAATRLLVDEPVIPLHALAGPREVQERTGIPKGSFGYRMAKDGMPRPVLTLSSTRLWDMRQIDAWMASRTRPDDPED